MNKLLALNQVKIEKAKETDWKAILFLLDEVGLKEYLSENESYKNFYVVKNPDDGITICCFSINCEATIGILKSFGIKKDLQGSGIGKYIANKIPSAIKELGLKRIYASSWEAPKFWAKTNFTEISKDNIIEKFFLDYINCLEKDYPQFTKKLKHFVLNLA